jgi:prolipoprotein diacylglyceryltransferase
MDFPFYVKIGGTSILVHSIIEPLAFFAGFRYLIYLKRRRGDILDSKARFSVILAAIFGALLGSRLVGGLENPVPLFEGENWLIHFYKNKTILGGLLGGLLVVEMVRKLKDIKEASGDLFVYPVILAMIIGRLGCFTMGIHPPLFWELIWVIISAGTRLPSTKFYSLSCYGFLSGFYLNGITS